MKRIIIVIYIMHLCISLHSNDVLLNVDYDFVDPIYISSSDRFNILQKSFLYDETRLADIERNLKAEYDIYSNSLITKLKEQVKVDLASTITSKNNISDSLQNDIEDKEAIILEIERQITQANEEILELKKQKKSLNITITDYSSKLEAIKNKLNNKEFKYILSIIIPVILVILIIFIIISKTSKKGNYKQYYIHHKENRNKYGDDVKVDQNKDNFSLNKIGEKLYKDAYYEVFKDMLHTALEKDVSSNKESFESSFETIQSAISRMKSEETITDIYNEVYFNEISTMDSLISDFRTIEAKSKSLKRKIKEYTKFYLRSLLRIKTQLKSYSEIVKKTELSKNISAIMDLKNMMNQIDKIINALKEK